MDMAWVDAGAAELAVLGSAIVYGSAGGLNLTPDEFSRPMHARLYSELLRLHRSGVPTTDKAAWTQAFKSAGVDVLYRLDMVEHASSAPCKYAEQVRAASQANRLIDAMRAVAVRLSECPLVDLPEEMERLQHIREALGA